jgi:hypothetical protein
MEGEDAALRRRTKDAASAARKARQSKKRALHFSPRNGILSKRED